MTRYEELTAGTNATERVVVYVHGTFTPNASWTRIDSPLSHALLLARPDTRIYKVNWTGNNGVADRTDAARSVGQCIGEINSKFPRAAIFLIGHSHGGSAIAYYLKREPHMARQLAGVCFLSTPFYAIAKRRSAEVFNVILPYAFALSLVWLLVSLAGWWVIYWASREEVGYLRHYAYLGFLLIAAIFVWSLSWPEFLGNSLLNYWRELVLFKKTTATAFLPAAGNYFVLRTTGDEAAAFLSGFQFINDVIDRLGAMVGTIGAGLVRAFAAPLRNPIMKFFYAYAQFGLGSLVATFIGLATGWCLNEALLEGRSLSGTVLDGWGVISNDWPAVLFALALFAFGIFGLAALFAILLALFCVVAVVGYMVFGGLPALSALYLNVTVEPCPIGAYPFHLLQRHPKPSSGIFGLGHSESHDHPEAIRLIVQWIGESTG